MTKPDQRSAAEVANEYREAQLRMLELREKRLREDRARLERGETPVRLFDKFASLRLSPEIFDRVSDSDLGSMIARLRKERGVTQQDLAAALRVSQSTVTDWERNKTRPRKRFHKEIIRFLGQEIEAYLNYDKVFDLNAQNNLPDGKSFLELSNKKRYIAFVEILYRELVSRDCNFHPIDLAIISFEIWSTVNSPLSSTPSDGLVDELLESIDHSVSRLEEKIRSWEDYARRQTEQK